jgi:hypothetical protein
VKSLPDFGKVCFPDMRAIELSLLIPRASRQQLKFLAALIQLNPARRLTASQVS